MILDVVYNHLGASGIEALDAFGPVLHRQHGRRGARRSTSTTPTSDPVREWVDPERRALGPRLPRRRPAARRGARDLRRDARAHRRASSPRARARRRPGRARDRRERPQRPATMRARAEGGWGCDAQWADDFHHALHVAAHRRARRLLRRLRPTSPTLAKAFGRAVRLRRHVLELPRAAASARRPDDVAPEQFVVFAAEPRPGRQPRARRPARRRRRRPLAALLTLSRTVHADALHGRGVRRARAVPVLHRPHRPGDRHGDPRGPAARVRRVRRVRRGGARPAGPGDLRALEARPARASPRAARALRGRAGAARASCAGEEAQRRARDGTPAHGAPRPVRDARQLRATSRGRSTASRC